MPATQPAQLHELCQNAFNAGNDEALAALYEEDAVFVTGPGSSITGRAAIRKAYAAFWSMKPVMRLETASATMRGDLALLEGKWVLIGASPEGDQVHITGTSHEVVRRQPDGTWLYAIDDPGADR
uniref:SnoaL-like domain-containing protein n=1 Tax=Solibacter usitatus (strain Ellin6076) TaxID=234267 RepID=Q01TW3_SOLUE